MDVIMREIAERIESLMKERGVSKTDLARYCGHTPGWLNNILYEGKDIKLPDILKVAEFLKVHVIELLPVPQRLDIEKMTMRDLMRHIAREECEKYIKEKKLIRQ